jgi:hypothetical protein
MKQTQIEIVAKIFVVAGSTRKCLVCDGSFSPAQAVTHATILCYPCRETLAPEGRHKAF